MLPVALEDDYSENAVVDEVESIARARRCPCGKYVRFLRALHGRKHCCGLCARRYG
jgi:hypothetical protein